MNIRVADKAWIAAALLHQENPESADFAAREIRLRAIREFNDSDASHSLWYHIITHCVAGKKANPGNYRMFHQTGRGRRRLFRTGDLFHPDRKGKQTPMREQIPQKYWPLIDWYESDYNRSNGGGYPPTNSSSASPDGSGKNWLRFVGYINAHDLELMKRAIEEEFETVYPE